MAISKAKQIAELVKGVNATLKARANAGKVQQMTKDSVIPKDINGFFDDAVGKKFPTVEDDFVTTASKMSFAKSGLNASLGSADSVVICWTLPDKALAFKVALTPLTNSAICFALEIAIIY